MDCAITTTADSFIPTQSFPSVVPILRGIYYKIKAGKYSGYGQEIPITTYALSSSSSFIPVTNVRISGSGLAYNDSSITTIGSCVMANDLNAKSVQKLRTFLTFEPNWNGYGAVQFSTQYILKVNKLLEAMPVKTEVFPIPDGRVQFEYRRADGSYMEIEINDDDTIEVFSVAADKSEQEYTAGYADIVRIVNEFYG